MCGRIDLHTPAAEIARVFHAVPGFDAAAVKGGWNIAPARRILAVIAADGARALVGLSWGFLARWASDASGPKPINARAETVFARPMFRDSAHRRRCLIPVDGFYEWKHEGGRRLPYYFRLADGVPFALGGIWERWSPRDRDGQREALHTCAILTTAANEPMAPIHDRMPLVIGPSDHQRWLAGEATSGDDLARMLRPYDGSQMVRWRVGERVNHAANDGAQLLRPVPD